MLPLGLSSLELRNIIECAFLPLHCTCSCSTNNVLDIQISDLKTGKVHLFKRGVPPDRLASSRAISNLIAEMRAELATDQAARSESVMPAARKVRYG